MESESKKTDFKVKLEAEVADEVELDDDEN